MSTASSGFTSRIASCSTRKQTVCKEEAAAAAAEMTSGWRIHFFTPHLSPLDYWPRALNGVVIASTRGWDGRNGAVISTTDLCATPTFHTGSEEENDDVHDKEERVYRSRSLAWHVLSLANKETRANSTPPSDTSGYIVRAIIWMFSTCFRVMYSTIFVLVSIAPEKNHKIHLLWLCGSKFGLCVFLFYVFFSQNREKKLCISTYLETARREAVRALLYRSWLQRGVDERRLLAAKQKQKTAITTTTT